MPTFSEAQEWAVWTAAISAGLAGVLYIVAKVRQGVRGLVHGWKTMRRRFDALENLIQHELTPNSGGSMYDAVKRLDAATARNDQRLTALESHLSTLADSQRHIWPAIEAVAKAEPPGRNPHEA